MKQQFKESIFLLICYTVGIETQLWLKWWNKKYFFFTLVVCSSAVLTREPRSPFLAWKSCRRELIKLIVLDSELGKPHTQKRCISHLYKLWLLVVLFQFSFPQGTSVIPLRCLVLAAARRGACLQVFFCFVFFCHPASSEKDTASVALWLCSGLAVVWWRLSSVARDWKSGLLVRRLSLTTSMFSVLTEVPMLLWPECNYCMCV